jgi:hypothetical protein
LAIAKGWGTPKGKLADYVNATKGTILVGDIQAHMLKEHSKPSTRRQDIIHPSEMAKADWCPRSTYYRIQACRDADDPYLKPDERVGVQLLNIFDEGHLIHDKWQKRLRDMGKLWGNWQCIYCKKNYKNCFGPDFCIKCDSTTLIYREVPLRSEQYLIAGHADGAIPHLDALIEIKSVGAGTVRIEAPDIYAAHTEGQKIDLQGLWKAIQEPFPAHVRQGQLYLALCAQMDLPFTKIIFIYEAKFNQGVKEFVVKYDPNYSKPLLQNAFAIVNALDFGGDIPSCPTGTCKDCEKYGSESTERLGNEGNGSESPFTAVRRPAGTTGRIVRPS